MKNIVLLLAYLAFHVSMFSQNSCLVASYPFNGNAEDISGNGYNATVFGASLTTDRHGNPQSAYEFDGVDDYINTFSSFDFEYRTVALWMLYYDDSSSKQIVLTQDANSLDYGAVSVGIRSGGELRVRGGGNPITVIDSNLQPNNWYHIVLVRNKKETKYYLNGSLIETANANSLGSLSYQNKNLIMGISRHLDRDLFSGIIDDVKIYDCELNATQIDSIYQAEKVNSSVASCLDARYNFNGNIKDATGNHVDPINYGAELTTDRFGNPNGALEFIEDDFLDTRVSFDYPEQTTAVWFKTYDNTNTSFVFVQDANTLDYGALELKLKNGGIYVNPGGEGPQLVESNLKKDQWYHVVLTRSTTESRAYVNGQLKYSGTPTSSGSGHGANELMTLGTNRYRSSQFFQGKIDHFEVYNCALSAAQIDSLYNAESPLPNPQTCRFVHYTFNGHTLDTTGNSPVPYVEGTHYTSDRNQNPDQALKLDGNDFLDTRKSFDFEHQTTSVWFMPYDVSQTSFVYVQDANTLSHGTIEIKLKNGALYANPGGEGPQLVYPNLQENKWYNLVMTRDGAVTNVFVDGLLAYSGTPTSSGSTHGAYDNLVLGTNRYRSGQFFRGKIDDLEIYDCVLVQNEVQKLMSSSPHYAKQKYAFNLNPTIANNAINLDLNNIADKEIEIKVYNHTGQLVRVISKKSSQLTTINVSDLSAGMHLINISSEKENFGTKRFIIQR